MTHELVDRFDDVLAFMLLLPLQVNVLGANNLMTPL